MLRLMLLKSGSAAAGQFAIGARDILLFKKHPEATSARNMLPCVVRRMYETEWLIAEVVPQRWSFSPAARRRLC